MEPGTLPLAQGPSVSRFTPISLNPVVTPPDPDLLYPQPLTDLAQDLDVPKDWRHEMRHQAQKVAPGLWLGSYNVSRNLTQLKEMGITHILMIRDARESAFVRARFPDSIYYWTLEMQDNQQQRIISFFNDAIHFIDAAIKQGGKVLVHCHTGITLSPVVVIAYIMNTYHKSAEQATAHVQSYRYCLSVKPSFGKQLREYEAIYKAQLAMSNNPIYATDQSAKRGVGDIYDIDEQAAEHEARAIRKLPASYPPITFGSEMECNRVFLSPSLEGS